MEKEERVKRKKVRTGHTLWEDDLEYLDQEVYDLKLDNRSQLFGIMIKFYKEYKDKVEY
ncbi:hypothetical protein P9443_19105 [Peribacillus frigoritolerans]|uniref:hypothetical protein n=1 Tax=Peribacillus frigoritolerans TaxID=450367 RepID=UPI002E1DEE7F|nr:hypothetical protein [Peribacillus frigoritolerans]